FFAFKAFEQRRLLTADVGAGAMMDIKIEVPLVHVVFADQLGLIGLVDRRLQPLTLADELATYIDVAGLRAHRETGDQAALDQEMRIVPHDLSVLAGAGLGFVGIDDEILWPAVRLLRHERPLQSGRKASPAAPAQSGTLHLLDNGVAALREDSLGPVPGAARTRALEAPVMLAVQVFENPILVSQHGSRLLLQRGRAAHGRRQLSVDLRARLHFLARREIIEDLVETLGRQVL